MVLMRAAAIGFLTLVSGCTAVDTLTPTNSSLQLGYPQIPPVVSRAPLVSAPAAVAVPASTAVPAEARSPRALPLNANVLPPSPAASREENAVPPENDADTRLPSEGLSGTSIYNYDTDPTITAALVKPLSDAERNKMFLELAEKGTSYTSPPPPVISLADVATAMKNSALKLQ